MIQEDYCSKELCLLLKQKKINAVHKHAYFNPDADGYKEHYCKYSHSVVRKWLREKHHIYADPIRQGNYDDRLNEYSWIVASGGKIYRNSTVVDKLSYKEAVEAALKYALENLI